MFYRNEQRLSVYSASASYDGTGVPADSSEPALRTHICDMFASICYLSSSDNTDGMTVSESRIYLLHTTARYLPDGGFASGMLIVSRDGAIYNVLSVWRGGADIYMKLEMVS